VAVARQAQAQGFTRFKIAPFDGLTPALCGSSQGQAIIHRGIDCLQALRDAMGPEVLLMVDCHWRMDEARALSTLALLEPVGLHWFECPLAETHANWPALRRIRRAARQQGVLLAAAETQVGLSSFQAVFEEALYDVVMPDVKYCGGPWEMLRIAQQAHTHGVQFSPHNPSGPVCTWQSLQVALVAPACAMLELQFAGQHALVHPLMRRVEAPGVAHHGSNTGALLCRNHGLGVAQRVRHRDLDEHVPARLHDGDRLRRVHLGRGGEHDGVGVALVHRLHEIECPKRDAPLVGQRLGVLGIAPAERNDLDTVDSS
jgi:hypothetical protein